MTEQQAEEKARELINQMTLKEKVFEMRGHGVVRFGLSIIFSKKIKPVHAGGCKRLEIPVTIFLDGPRGVSLHKGATAFPVTMARGASWDTGLEERIGEAMAEEIRALGANYSGAVCMNLLRHPAWGRAQETYGEDSYHIGEMASALVAGIQKHHVQACAKHFAANSMENNRFGGNITMNERTLQEVYLPHFKKAVQQGVASVMSAYNKLNGEYCGENKALLHDILRNDFGFKGYVTSDWMNGLYNTQKGIEAGMNVEMPSGRCYTLKKIKELLHENKITVQQIDDLVFPIVRTKLLFTSRADKQSYPKSLVGCKAHIELAQEAAEKSAVLLKNENNFLPLDKNKVKKIAVIGSLADIKQTGDHGSSRVFPLHIISSLEGIKNYLFENNSKVVTAPADDIEAVKTICRNADAVIIVAGATYKDEGEYIGNGKIRNPENPDKQNFMTRTGILGLGGDRNYLHLHSTDIDIIHAVSSVNKNIAVCLIAGSAITVSEWHNETPAILQTFYNGMEGGTALARILFGDVNPSGKLPFTVPVSENDLPPFNSYSHEAEYGYYHGYTLFDKENKLPQYPFGFGLSYTSFEISDLKISPSVDSCNMAVSVKNTGEREGAEVVQVYIGFAGNMQQPDSIGMPEKLLKNFSKIYLQPKEEKKVQFTVALKDLAHYIPERKIWFTEKGLYKVMVGNSSRSSKMLTGSFTVY